MDKRERDRDEKEREYRKKSIPETPNIVNQFTRPDDRTRPKEGGIFHTSRKTKSDWVIHSTSIINSRKDQHQLLKGVEKHREDRETDHPRTGIKEVQTPAQ